MLYHTSIRSPSEMGGVIKAVTPESHFRDGWDTVLQFNPFDNYAWFSTTVFVEKPVLLAAEMFWVYGVEYSDLVNALTFSKRDLKTLRSRGVYGMENCVLGELPGPTISYRTVEEVCVNKIRVTGGHSRTMAHADVVLSTGLVLSKCLVQLVCDCGSPNCNWGDLEDRIARKTVLPCEKVAA
jgi:hypothetical protein